jgi:hypothetical protein
VTRNGVADRDATLYLSARLGDEILKLRRLVETEAQS